MGCQSTCKEKQNFGDVNEKGWLSLVWTNISHALTSRALVKNTSLAVTGLFVEKLN